ncbi:RNA 3'-terminal phosphate cyclase-like protein [Nephila pilipes]|uniref:RNA 3'-terminal phosphate cyclase-like protein n=1 Tax=Nephila pilipes TaxID=299642 RepID=A0A8X6QKA0_NEPPI|nr:RNA 3'-terminal phosphate cyclase-like protein [Nephila pilipes]
MTTTLKKGSYNEENFSSCSESMKQLEQYLDTVFKTTRLILSTLSAKPIHIKNIRDTFEEPGINESEHSFLKLLDIITNGSVTIVNETGTVVRYTPGILLGGTLQHDCGIGRAIGYYLEALLCLAPFCKKPLHITLKGVTNDSIDPSVDSIMHSSIPVLKRFILNDENLEIKIISRGLPPEGGGEVLFRCPVVNTIRPIKGLDPGKIKRIRGYAYSVRVSPAMSRRMVDASKGLLLKFLPDVYIYSDHYKGKHSGKSPGFGLTLIAESTTGVFYAAEAISKPSGSGDDFIVPEDVAKQACYNLFEEINRGGFVDSNNQSLVCLLMALGPADVSKVKTGPLSLYTIQFLRHIEDFLQLRMKLETVKDEKLQLGTHKVIVTCLGIGFSNLSRNVS